MTRPVLVAVLLCAILAACSSSSSSNGLPNPVGVDRNPLLHQVTSCNQLETAIEDALVLEEKTQIEQIRKSDYYIGYGGGPVGAPVSLDGGVAAGPLTPSSGGFAGPTSVSTTNTQVAGVDEADFVQNDGTRIAVLAGGKLHLLSSWPPQAMAETASLTIDGWPRDMFLAGNQVVVFSMVYVPRPIEGNHPICAPGPVAVGAASTVAAFCGYWASDVTEITTIDVSDLSSPKVTAQILLPGAYLSARRIDQRVRVVMSDSLPFPDGVRFWPDLPPGATTEQRNKAFDELEAANEALIRSRTLDDWLRKGELRVPGEATTPISYNCSDFSLSTAPTRPGLLTIATVDLTSDSLKSRTAVLADPGTVYASKDTLYVAAAHWWWWPEIGQTDATYIHAFDLTNPDRAGYIGSGTVDGSVRDQYSMDEFSGALRVATHLTTRVADGTPWGTLKGANRISVLTPTQGKLEFTGKTADYGADETTFGTRFLGTRGFVITARQVDPLFTFDLSDPKNPTKVGELEMPGFISYLHPIDDTHLLGIGREVNFTPMGETAQVKVALLDVTNLSDPKAQAVQLVGQGFSYSEALWDPKAFTWLPSQKMLAIPFVDYGTQTFVSDLRLFQVDPAAGTITAKGSLSMADVFQTWTGENWSYSWSPWIRRGILADAQDGQYVYAISDAGVRSAKVASLPAWLQTVKFPPLVYP
ncbi:MAG TPA: beta-propeller domain-containing protein [Myxococcaceae bacterium]|nr:beta-propeller domain-containing protein [Myxococcaceae bacterium]